MVFRMIGGLNVARKSYNFSSYNWCLLMKPKHQMLFDLDWNGQCCEKTINVIKRISLTKKTPIRNAKLWIYRIIQLFWTKCDQTAIKRKWSWEFYFHSKIFSYTMERVYSTAWEIILQNKNCLKTINLHIWVWQDYQLIWLSMSWQFCQTTIAKRK